MSEQNIELTGYPSIDKPWLKWYTYEEEGKVEQKKELTGYPSID